jgi:excinuclease ABC subunit B
VVDDPTAKRPTIAPSRARKPSLDEMGPGVESIPAGKTSPRSTLGKPGMRGGFKPRRR